MNASLLTNERLGLRSSQVILLAGLCDLDVFHFFQSPQIRIGRHHKELAPKTFLALALRTGILWPFRNCLNWVWARNACASRLQGADAGTRSADGADAHDPLKPVRQRRKGAGQASGSIDAMANEAGADLCYRQCVPATAHSPRRRQTRVIRRNNMLVSEARDFAHLKAAVLVLVRLRSGAGVTSD